MLLSIADRKIERKDIYVASLCSLISFVVYLNTLCPTVYVVGSGELITAAHTLGIAHPTGYPLYCLLARIFSLLVPGGNVPFKINLISAIFGSSSIFVFYLLLYRLTKSVAASFSSALIFAFSSGFWSQSVTAEVYTLNILLMSLLTFALLTWERTLDKRYLALSAFMFGLSLSNHLTSVLLLPALIFFLVSSPGRIRLKDFAYLLPLVILGLTPYIYLPLRDDPSLPFRWAPVDTLSDFLRYMLTYSHRMFSLPFQLQAESALYNLLKYIKSLPREFTTYVIWLAPVGMVANMKSNRRIFAFSALIFTLSVFYAINYRILDIQVFFIPSFFVVSIWIAYALTYIQQKTGEISFGFSTRNVISAVMIALAVFPLAFNFHRNDLSQNRLAYDYGRDILRSLDHSAVLLTEGDDASFILDYLKVVENMRPDVDLYHRDGPVFSGIYGKDYAKLPFQQKSKFRRRVERALIQKEDRPVYYVIKKNLDFAPGYTLMPEGLCYRVVKEGSDYRIRDHFGNFVDPDSLSTTPSYKDKWTAKIVSNYHFSKADFYIALQDTLKAFQEYEKASTVAPESATLHYNLGIVYFRAKRYFKAEEKLKKAIQLDPYRSPPYYLLARVKLAQRERGEGRSYLEKAVPLNPNNRKAAEYLRRMRGRL